MVGCDACDRGTGDGRTVVAGGGAAAREVTHGRARGGLDGDPRRSATADAIVRAGRAYHAKRHDASAARRAAASSGARRTTRAPGARDATGAGVTGSAAVSA